MIVTLCMTQAQFVKIHKFVFNLHLQIFGIFKQNIRKTTAMISVLKVGYNSRLSWK